MMRTFFLLAILFFIPLAAMAQHTLRYTSPEAYYRTGLDLLEREQYSAARQAFEKYLANTETDPVKTAEAAYYQAYTALAANDGDGETLLEEFIDAYPESPRASTARFDLGLFYYKKGNYNKAAEALEAADMRALSPEQRSEATFKLGYALFTQKEFDKALVAFNKIKATKSPYTHAASYYAGFLEFRQQEYDRALIDLRRAAEEASYAAVVPYMIANVYYAQGRYDELLQYAQEVLNKPDVKNKSDINLLVAEAYFKKEKYEKAASNFEDYAQSINGKPENPILYRMGYSQYVTGKNAQAIDNLKVVALGQDTLAQYASYYLGHLYLRESNKPYAASAFDKARKLRLNEDITREAHFQQAKVQIDLGDFDQAIALLEEYSKNYGQGGNSEEASELLSEALLQTSNYDKALAYIDNLPSKTSRIRKAYQKIAFLKGTELFNDGKFYNAVQAFKKSLEYPQDPEIVEKAHFWSAEAYSIGKKWPEATESYQAVLRAGTPASIQSLKARYGLGYAYFNTQQYKKALVHFREYTERLESASNKMFYEDALLRLADSYYASKLYNEALATYEKALKVGVSDRDYALYQRGVVLGIKDNVSAATTALQEVIDRYPNSPQHDDAMFEKARLQFEEGNYQVAINNFSALLNRHPKSDYVPFTLVRRALSYYNLQQFDQSANDYRKILDTYPSHEVANSALLGLQDVLNQQGKAGEFDKYVKLYKQANPASEELKSIEFESARNLYFSQNYSQAVRSLLEYLQEYPATPYTTEARYYLGESYYRLGQTEEAIRFHQQVLKETNNNFANRSLVRLGEMQETRGNLESAAGYYRQLVNNARNKKEQSIGWAGLINVYYARQDYDSTEYFARQLLEKGVGATGYRNQASLYVGKAQLQKGNLEAATDEFLNTINSARDEYGAEAKYLLAFIQHRQKQYRESIQTLFELNNNFAAYEKWIGKSFLLIADNYLALDEIFQAKATLESIVQKSPDQEAVAAARKKLREIERREQDLKRQQQPADSAQFEVIEN